MVYVSHLLTDEKMKEIIEKTGVGVESIEFSVAENLDQLGKSLETYQKRLEFMGCRELNLHGPFLDLNPMAFDSLVQEATRLRYEQAYQAAKELGARRLILHSGFIPSVYFLMGWADRMVDFYQRFLDDKDDSVEILMENVMDPLPEPVRAVAKGIDHPAFGLCLDVGHANCFSKIPVSTWATELRSFVRHLHLHDNAGDRDTHLALGKGTVPLSDVLDIFSKNPDISYTIECNTAADVRASLSWMRPPNLTSGKSPDSQV